jgi:hypothetical protein
MTQKFDWRRFCKEYGVHFVEYGANVSSGNVNCRCPFCDDPSEHLGLSLDIKSPSWGCWRCRAAGRSPVRLVCRLAGITVPAAMQIVALHNQSSPDEFERLLDPPQEAPNPLRGAAQKLPVGCRVLDGGVGARRFVQYLAEERGFGGDALRLAKRYSLHYALVGDQASRVIFPVYEKGLLQAWTGRAIHAQSPLRYKADYGGKIKQCLANSDALLGESHQEETLVIAEGPMDFLKLDFFGAIHRLRATCTFGTAWSLIQVSKLIPIVRQFKRTVVLYDQEAYMEGAQLAEEVKVHSHCDVVAMEMFGAKDPGALTPRGVAHLAKELTS